MRSKTPHPLLAALELAYLHHGLAGGSVLLAVSGGADSRALLVGTAELAPRLGLRAEVATLDHGLRAEAVREVEDVCALAARLGVPAHARALGLEAGPGVEARARTARYAALEAVRRERGLGCVATAHTASDQAETLLMRLVRGTSLTGARGVLARDGTRVRPLLAVTRAAVEDFLRARQVPWAEDPTNRDPHLLRARVRHGALPALEAAAGHPVAAPLARFAAFAAEDEAWLADFADAAWARLAQPGGGLDAVGVRALAPPVRRRVVARLLAESGLPVDAALLARALLALERGGACALGHGAQLRSAGGWLRVAPGAVGLPAPGMLVLTPEAPEGEQPGTGWRFRLVRGGREGALPLDEPVAWPLTVRPRAAGDRVATAAGHRAVQDVLVDRRVPRELRARVPLVVDATGRVLWLVGVDRAPAVRAGPDALHLEALAPPAGSARAARAL